MVTKPTPEEQEEAKLISHDYADWGIVDDYKAKVNQILGSGRQLPEEHYAKNMELFREGGMITLLNLHASDTKSELDSDDTATGTWDPTGFLPSPRN